MRHVVVMVTTSYPRFPGDGIGSFMEPIATNVAALGHEVHVVAPWHPAITRGSHEQGVFLHFYRYAPIPSLNVFGYARGLRADTHLKWGAWLAAPTALTAGWLEARRVAARHRATVMHAHWVVPNGVIAAMAAGGRPIVVSLHGSDVYVAERHWPARRAARTVLRLAKWTTACSDDLRRRAIALGASPSACETVPYGVDISRFAPDVETRARVRRELGVGDAPLLFSAGRLVRKKGFDVLIDAVHLLARDRPALRLVIAGDGDLRAELLARAQPAGDAVRLLGETSQDDVARLAAAADIVVIPSVHDVEGNVDGLPNFALEAMATATPVIASRVGGLADALHDGATGRLVAERDAGELAAVILELLSDRVTGGRLGAAARRHVAAHFGWDAMARRFQAAYDRAVQPRVAAQ